MWNSWTADSGSVVTVSRDGQCKVWRVQQQQQSLSRNNPLVEVGGVALECVHSFAPFGGNSVTAVDVCRRADFSSTASETCMNE